MASTIKVDKLDPQSGTALEIGTSGDTVTVPSGVGLTLTDSTLLLPTTITSTTEVKTNKISPATGTAFALGDSGDTFTVPSGATIVNSGTATGFGGTNTPAFQAYLSSTQTVVDGTETKIEMDTEDFDTDSDYDNSSNYRFTPQTAGKYYVYATTRGDTSVSSLGLQMTAIYLNGATHAENQVDYRNNDALLAGINVGVIIDMNGSSDYVECYARCLGGTSILASPTRCSLFGAYKLVGV